MIRNITKDRLTEDARCHYDSILKKAGEYRLQECFSKNLVLLHQIDYLKAKFKTGLVDYIWDDLLVCIDELRYSLASVLFYQDLGLADIRIPYNPSKIDWLFCYFVDNSYSQLYSAWNRVGNFLNVFFKTIKNKKGIYFYNVIDTLNIADNIYYFKLKKFRDTEFRYIISPHRNEIIHNQTSYYIIIKEFVENNNYAEKLKKLQLERDERQLFLVKQHTFVNNSLKDIIKLIQRQFPNNV